MIENGRFPKVLLLLAAFVFFSTNTVHFLESGTGTSSDTNDPAYNFRFDTVRKGPYLNLKAALLVNYKNGEVLYAKRADSVRPIASITKLVTAMVVLDKDVDLTQTETISKDDAYRSSKSRLYRGYELTLEDLMYSALLCSDNRAARALARATSGSIEAFVKEMNLKVRQLGLEHTVFYEPTGLDQRNVSTAHEVAKILHYAYDYPLIKKMTATKRHRVRIQNRKGKWLWMGNTNRMIYSPYKVLSGKTGYIQAADYCLTTLLKNKAGEELTCVVLGVPGDRTRFREARKLVDWGFKQLSNDRALALK